MTIPPFIPIIRFPVRLGCLCLLLLIGMGERSVVQAQNNLSERRLRLYQEKHLRLQQKFASEMNALAAVCESQSYFKDADEIRRRAGLAGSISAELDQLPAEPLPSIPLTLPEPERQWRLKLRKLETDYANELYRIARDALHQGYPSMVFQLIRETAYHNPDHKNARGMLGYVLDKGKWTTSFERTMATRKVVNHPRFGWIEEKNVARYENGERLLDGEWMSAEKEAAVRSDFKYAWEVGSEHFLVRTNHSLEKGVEISRALEEFHHYFQREFTAFFSSPQQMERLLEAGSNAKWNPAGRYRVNYYRNKDEFVSALVSRQPQIEKANGLYMPHDRIAYFYDDAQSSDAPEQRAGRQETMYHEVTHQLLGESRPRTADVGEKGNFWVIEGFPCYMESYRPEDPERQIGDPRHIRIHWARKRALEEGVYWPMQAFTRLGRAQFPLEADAYNQAAGMAHFFLNYDGGIYRDAFIQYLSNLYDPAASLRPQSVNLELLTGVKFDVLDQQYQDYLKGLDVADPVPASP